MKTGSIQCGYYFIVLITLFLGDMSSYPHSALVADEDSSLVRLEDSHSSL